MNILYVCIFACLAALAVAKPSGILGHGHGPLALVGASGVVSRDGAAGPTGIVTGNGAIGPNGIPNAVGHVGVGLVGGWDDGQWRGEGILESQDWAGHRGVGIITPGAAIVAPSAAAVVTHGGVGLVDAVGTRGLGLGVHGLDLGINGLGLGVNGLGLGINGLGLGINGLGHGAVIAGPAGAIVSNIAGGHVGLGHKGLLW